MIGILKKWSVWEERMLSPCYLFGISALVATVAVLSIDAHGQTYPTKTIRVITAPVGGGSDTVARSIAQGISGRLNQQLIVDNRPAGLIPTELVARANPDGYTLLVTSNVLWIMPLMQKVSYDPFENFSPVSFTHTSALVLLVHPSVAANSVKELIAVAKAKPGMLNYGSSSIGGAAHLAGELLKNMAGINIVHIPYKGIALIMGDLFSGQVQMTFFTGTSMMPHVRSGKLKALGVTSANPSIVYPELPTIAASGLPGYEAGSIYGVFAPGKTPYAIRKQLDQEIARYLATTGAKQQSLTAGLEVSHTSAENIAAVMKAEMVRMEKVIREAGIHAE